MDIQEENNLIQEAFEVEADEVGFCLDQKWGDYENPYENSDTALAFNLFKKGWQAAKAQAVPEGFVLVNAEQLNQWGHMANAAEQYGCCDCSESRGYAHNLACEINSYFEPVEAQEQSHE